MKRIINEISMLLFGIALLALQMLPFSSKLFFSRVTEDGKVSFCPFYYSSFNPIHLGYANFGPFFSAIDSCILVLLLILSFFVKSKTLQNSFLVLSGFGFLFSLFPFLLRTNTILTPFISLLWAFEIILFIIKKKGMIIDENNND